MSDEKVLYRVLKNKNFFEFGKTDSLEVLEAVNSLEDVIFRVERSCNTDNLFFRYDKSERIFYRIALSRDDFEVLNLDSLCKTLPQCKINGCLNKEIPFDCFIKLIKNGLFEAIAIYKLI